jgi:hypothetical protein
MPINSLYHTWFCRIREMRPNQRITQIRNFVWLIVGIHQSRSVSLSKIAMKMPGQAKLVSYTRRLSRFLDNSAIRVRIWYESIARDWLEAQFNCLGEIRLILDCTKVGFKHQMLMVCLAYRKRGIPIAWTWVPHVKGHSMAYKQLALLGYVRKLLPKGAAVFLVGDNEFGAVEILRQLNLWGWFYVLRQKGRTHIWLSEEEGWRDFRHFVHKPGQSRWLGEGCLTEKDIQPVNLLAHWKFGEEDPWCLATNLPDRQMTLRYYARRMWIDEMFGDMKKHGFDLECTMLRHFLRLSRLTLAVALLYVWMISVGTKTIHAGQRSLVDRKDRRDLSIFQIGLRIIDRFLINAMPFKLILCKHL